MSNYHIPVLLQEVREGLAIKKNGRYIDATLGGGGHTSDIVQQGGTVLSIDVDEDALAFAKTRLESEQKGEAVTLVRGNFKDIDVLAQKYGYTRVDGILFDFGVSSFQLDNAEKGFSFQQNGPLDMRMDKTLQVSAADLVNGLTGHELFDLFTRLGEERNAKRIAAEIVSQRQIQQITTTQDLVTVIEKAFGVTNEIISPKRRSEMCMRVFQALRIAVNDELGVIRDALPKAVALLRENGRLVVISFHSLEDRVVKQTFLDFEKKGKGKILTKKPLVATDEEIRENRRSRSAKVRIFEKL